MVWWLEYPIELSQYPIRKVLLAVGRPIEFGSGALFPATTVAAIFLLVFPRPVPGPRIKRWKDNEIIKALIQWAPSAPGRRIHQNASSHIAGTLADSIDSIFHVALCTQTHKHTFNQSMSCARVCVCVRARFYLLVEAKTPTNIQGGSQRSLPLSVNYFWRC